MNPRILYTGYMINFKIIHVDVLNKELLINFFHLKSNENHFYKDIFCSYTVGTILVTVQKQCVTLFMSSIGIANKLYLTTFTTWS